MAPSACWIVSRGVSRLLFGRYLLLLDIRHMCKHLFVPAAGGSDTRLEYRALLLPVRPRVEQSGAVQFQQLAPPRILLLLWRLTSPSPRRDRRGTRRTAPCRAAALQANGILGRSTSPAPSTSPKLALDHPRPRDSTLAHYDRSGTLPTAALATAPRQLGCKAPPTPSRLVWYHPIPETTPAWTTN